VGSLPASCYALCYDNDTLMISHNLQESSGLSLF
jgi:hypothetical protein